MTPETKPRMFRKGGIKVDSAIADPSVTIIEAGNAFGLLLADSATDSPLHNKLILEDVLWVRCVPEGGIWNRMFNRRDMETRAFGEVALYRHDGRLFVAQDIESERYFPSPSIDPYVVVFITVEEYHALRQTAEQEAMESLLKSMEWLVHGLPGFSFDGESLIGPNNYANASAQFLDHEVMGGTDLRF